MSGFANKQVKGSNCNELLPNEDGSLNVIVIDGSGNPVCISANRDLCTQDIIHNPGLDGVITVAAGPATEIRVGPGNKAVRKIVTFQLLSSGRINFGFTALSQSFVAFKFQVVSYPLGPNSSLFISVPSGSKQIAVGEL